MIFSVILDGIVATQGGSRSTIPSRIVVSGDLLAIDINYYQSQGI